MKTVLDSAACGCINTVRIWPVGLQDLPSNAVGVLLNILAFSVTMVKTLNQIQYQYTVDLKCPFKHGSILMISS